MPRFVESDDVVLIYESPFGHLGKKLTTVCSKQFRSLSIGHVETSVALNWTETT